MVNEYILTSSEFAKLVDISTESLRSRRRRGMYEGQYLLRNKSYLWKRPRHTKVGPTAFDRSSMSRDSRSKLLAASGLNRGPSSSRLAASGLNHEPRAAVHGPRNKNNGNHRAGITKNYPNRHFEIANEIRMVAKAQRKIDGAAAEEIIPEVIELAKQRHREKLLKKCEPIKTISSVYGMGIYDARNETIISKRIRWSDEVEDEERSFWSKKYY